MSDEDFRIEGERRPDGAVYFTSPDLPGFRLLVEEPGDSNRYHEPILSALKQFYPLYKAAEARRKEFSLFDTEQSTERAQSSGRGFELVAHLATV